MGRWSGSSVTLRNNKIPELLPNYDIVPLLPLQLLVPLLSLPLLPPLLLPLLPLLLLPLHFKLLGKEPQNLKILLYDNFILAF